MAIKMIFCLHRRPDMSRDQFQRYWLEEHAPKVTAMAAQSGMTRYVQSHSYDSPLGSGAARARGTTGDYDGVMEGWWESEEAARAAFAAMPREAGRLLMDDERHFIDLERSQLFVTREHIIY
ncbi:MAG TPA: EthD domain-containing protein [Sphingobium sp.]